MLPAEAKTLKLALERGSDVEAVACGEVAETLSSRVNAIIVSPARETQKLQPKLVNPRRDALVGEQDVATFPKSGAGVGSCFFRAVRLHRDDAGDRVFQSVDDSGAVGIVFNEDARRSAGELDTGPFRELFDLGT